MYYVNVDARYNKIGASILDVNVLQYANNKSAGQSAETRCLINTFVARSTDRLIF